jgi:hypothetical protein
MRASRTYKLRLSNQGITLFLDCHCRLMHLARDFIPYGATLAVAVDLLANQEGHEVAGELVMHRCLNVAGDNVRFVGASAELMRLAQIICDKLLESGELAVAPRVGAIYAAALSSMVGAEDGQIQAAFDRIGYTGRKADR